MLLEMTHFLAWIENYELNKISRKIILVTVVHNIKILTYCHCICISITSLLIVFSNFVYCGLEWCLKASIFQFFES